MVEWICSRLALVFWACVVAHSLFAWLGVGTIAWRWAAAAWLFVAIQALLDVRRGESAERYGRGVFAEPLWRKLPRILIGGWIGALSWLVALLAIGAGWMIGRAFGAEAWGLAIGLVVAKITYIPWLAGILFEARRQPAPAPAKAS